MHTGPIKEPIVLEDADYSADFLSAAPLMDGTFEMRFVDACNGGAGYISLTPPDALRLAKYISTTFKGVKEDV